MIKPTFALASGISTTVQEGPACATLRIPLNGHSAKTVKKKTVVSAGTLVAEHPYPRRGDMHSPVTGVVKDVTDAYVLIEVQDDVEEAPAVEPVKLEGLSGPDLLGAMKKLGFDTDGFKKGATVINAVNPEPAVSVAEQVMGEGADMVGKGYEVLKRALPDNSFHVVTAQGASLDLPGATAATVAATYPNSLDELVVKAATGKERPEGVFCVPVTTLWGLGRAAETGMPCTETLMTIGGVNHLVKVGTPLAELLTAAGVTPGEGDAVIVGGPMRGKAVYDLEGGVGKGDHGLFHIPAGAFPPVSDQACVNCGECVLSCPSRIYPNMITRYVEFKMYDKAREYDIEACMECGLCAYHCTGRRPLLQYIRLGKTVLAAMDRDVAACGVQSMEELKVETSKDKGE